MLRPGEHHPEEDGGGEGPRLSESVESDGGAAGDGGEGGGVGGAAAARRGERHVLQDCQLQW